MKWKKATICFRSTTRSTTLTWSTLSHWIKFQHRNSTLCFNSKIDPRIVLRETRFALRTNTNFNRIVLTNGKSHRCSFEVELYSRSPRQFWNSRHKDNHHPNLAEVKLVIATVYRPPHVAAGRKLKKIFSIPRPRTLALKILCALRTQRQRTPTSLDIRKYTETERKRSLVNKYKGVGVSLFAGKA